MASIPHGTTINAPGTFLTVAGGPQIKKVDITPFSIDHPGNRIDFPANRHQHRNGADTPDLSVAPAITSVCSDPNTLLSDHIAGLTILFTDVSRSTQKPAQPGGGTGNIGFLVGDAAGPTQTLSRSRRPLIETVQAEIKVGPSNAENHKRSHLRLPAGAPALKFLDVSIGNNQKQSITGPTPDPVHQNVSPTSPRSPGHVSVATLVPSVDRRQDPRRPARGHLSGIAGSGSAWGPEAANPQIPIRI
jgi:hypothetical protein